MGISVSVPSPSAGVTSTSTQISDPETGGYAIGLNKLGLHPKKLNVKSTSIDVILAAVQISHPMYIIYKFVFVYQRAKDERPATGTLFCRSESRL